MKLIFLLSLDLGTGKSVNSKVHTKNFKYLYEPIRCALISMYNT